jgi:hypothetical protein
MSETVDLTLLSASMQELQRDVRLLRIQLDQLVGSVPPRLAVLEQSVHAIATELARGFGQMQQQLARHEARFDALDAGLTAVRSEIAASTERLVRLLTPAPD